MQHNFADIPPPKKKITDEKWFTLKLKNSSCVTAIDIEAVKSQTKDVKGNFIISQWTHIG